MLSDLAARDDSDAHPSSHRQILKSSALIGGASVVTTAVSLVRVKVIALLIGPAGVGLLALHSSVLELAQSIAAMGINSSGVRQIAAAVGSQDTQRVARTAAVLQTTSVVLGVAGASLMIVFRRPISVWTFGTSGFTGAIGWLSLALLFQSASAGQLALIQGMRRIADLARIGVLAGLCAAGITVTLVYTLREAAVVPSLVSAAAVTCLTAWWYRRKLRIDPIAVPTPRLREEAAALLTLGSVFMASAVLTAGAAYAVRITVRDEVGLEAAGCYQAAWALGGLYVSFILNAMGSDFYPRLTAVAHDNRECNRLVNEQAEVSALLAGPGVMATLTFAPLAIAVFYNATFASAVGPLRWICLGMMLRVLVWPMGFILVARGARSILFGTEVAAATVQVGFAFLCVRRFGVAGAGMAFFALNVCHGALIYLIVRRLTGFRWSAANRRGGVLFLALIGGVSGGFAVLPAAVATAAGTVALAVGGIHSLRALCRWVSPEQVPPILQGLLITCRIVPAEQYSSAASQ